MFPYDAEVLTQVYTQYNTAIWPAQPAALLLALAVFWLAAAPLHNMAGRGGARPVGAVLAAAWLWCGLVFFRGSMAPLDFMAPVYAWTFAAQAALLAWALLWRGLPMVFRPDGRGIGGLALAAFALFGLPLISGLGDAGFAAARLVGVAPGPTALFTLGLLLLAEGRARWLLMLLPLAWCAVAGVTAWALNIPEAWPLPVLGVVALGLALQRRHGA